MAATRAVTALALASLVKFAAGHASIYHPGMWGYNVTTEMFPYDNRPVIPLANMPFNQWWFHNHLAYPPHPEDYVDLPAGGATTLQISCDKGYTDYYASSPGGDIRDHNSDLACPGQPTTAIHANNIDDVGGCGLAIAYKSNVNDVKPEDFAIFSVNYTCPWYLKTVFDVPAEMPACPDGGCICAFFWIHRADSGSEQMYMNGFQCRVSGNTGSKPIGRPALARRCGADPANGKPEAVPSNCTVGPAQPMYWYQAEGNNMFEGTYSPPLYRDLYGFANGAQPNLFQEPTIGGAPAPPPPSNPSPASSSSASAVSLGISLPVSVPPSVQTPPSAVGVPASVQTPPAAVSVPASVQTPPAAVSVPASVQTPSAPVSVPESIYTPPAVGVPTSIQTPAAPVGVPGSVETPPAPVSVPNVAPTPPAPASPAKCKRRAPGEQKKKKRNAPTEKARRAHVDRHLKARLNRESH